MNAHISDTGTLRHASGRVLNLGEWPLSVTIIIPGFLLTPKTCIAEED